MTSAGFLRFGRRMAHMGTTPHSERNANVARPGPACPVCDYDLTGAPIGRCPECGLELVVRGETLPLWVRANCRRHLVLGLVNVGVIALGMGVWFALRGRDDSFKALMMLIAFGAPVAFGTVCGLLLAAFAPTPYRTLRRRVWFATFGWLQAPWIICLTAWPYLRWLNRIHPYPESVQWIFLLVYAIAIPTLCFTFWAFHWRHESRRAGDASGVYEAIPAGIAAVATLGASLPIIYAYSLIALGI